MVSTVQTTRFVLSDHREIPEAQQPALDLRYISRNDRLRIEQHFKAAGGNNGGSTPGTAATWTYTVKDYETGDVLKKNSAGDNATAMSPMKPRIPAQAAAATAGMACRKTDGTLVLVEAFEDYSKQTCA